MRCRDAAVLLVVAACGFPRPADVPDDGKIDAGDTPLAPTCTDASGSRIKLTVRRATDGATQVVGLYDSARNEPCRWGTAGDGQLRCMPVSNIGENYSDGYVAYSAAGCATPILGIFSNRLYPGKPFIGRDGGDIFGSGTPIGCEGVLRVFGVGALLADPTTVWVKDANGACASLPADNNTYNYYAAGAETAPSTFVAGTTTKDGTARVWLESIAGADGSHSCGDNFDFHDSAFGDAPCTTANYAYDEKRRCVLTGFGIGTMYTDSGCTASTRVMRRPNCRKPSAFATESMQTPVCNYGSLRVRAAGTELTGLFFKDSGSVCRAVQPTFTTYSVEGDYIPETMFPEVTYAFAQSGTRLSRRDLVTGGARLPTSTFHDPELDLTCQFELGADGIYRCAPGFGTESELVADGSYQIYTAADCSGTRGNYAITFPPSTPCSQPGAPRFVRLRDVNTGYNSYARVGNVANGSFYYKFSDSSPCMAVPASSMIYQIGASVMSELVTATDVRQ
jgi:hypothetical protein